MGGGKGSDVMRGGKKPRGTDIEGEKRSTEKMSPKEEGNSTEFRKDMRVLYLNNKNTHHDSRIYF